MRTINLVTTSFNDDGTYGVLIENRIPLNFRTLERPWKDNAKGLSCIPEGRYLVKREVTPKHGLTWQVCDVPGRDMILIHPGNTEKDVEGCILLGIEAGVISTLDPDNRQVEAQPAVLRSKEAQAMFDALLGTETEFTLNVVRRSAI